GVWTRTDQSTVHRDRPGKFRGSSNGPDCAYCLLTASRFLVLGMSYHDDDHFRAPIVRDGNHPAGVSMIPARFEYHVASDVPEAIALLGRYGDEAKLLAGGQSLIPLMRFRLAQPAHLIDIGRIGDLSYVLEDDGHLAIGALTREVELESSAIVAEHYSILMDA